MKAVIYARYSCENQNDQSIEGQIRECTEFAEKNDIEIVGTYVDRAQSGRTDDRYDFQRMLRDSDKKLFDVVIVWKLDRFGRNREETAINKVRLRKNGVKVLYAKENIPDAPEGIILESLLEGLAEYYSANLAQNVKRGLKDNALRGESTGGAIPYGYKVCADKKLHIDPVQAEAVRIAFDMYAQGRTIKDIANTLNEKGYRNSAGKEFKTKSFQGLLRNRKYTGVYTYDGITIENGMPAIIDKEIYDVVQQRIEKNRQAPARSKAKVDYLLTTKLFCGLCGQPMFGESGTSKSGTTYYYYKCKGNKQLKKCNKKAVRKEVVENCIIQNTFKKVLTDENIEKIADAVMLLYNKELNERSLSSDLERRQKEIEKALRNLMTAIEQGIITETTKKRLIELEAEKKEVEQQLIREQLKTPTISRDYVIYYLNKFKTSDLSDPDFPKRLIDTLVNSVYLYEDKIVITYNYSEDKTKTTHNAVTSALKVMCSDNSEVVGYCSSNPNIFVMYNVIIFIIQVP